MSDRIIVMREGRINGLIDKKEDFTEVKILSYAMQEKES